MSGFRATSADAAFVSLHPDVKRLWDLLAARQPKHIVDAAARRAAVLVPIIGGEASLRLLCFERTHAVLEHKGEICFPGGSMEATDADAAATALREAHEELGLLAGEVQVIGQLDDVHTVASNYVIAPVVGYLPQLPALVLDPLEVARPVIVTVDHLRTPGVGRTETRTFQGVARVLPYYQVQDGRIWGATARILNTLLKLWPATATMDP